MPNFIINYSEQFVGAIFTGITTFFAGIGIAKSEQLLQPKAQVVWWCPRDIVFELPIREAAQNKDLQIESTAIHDSGTVAQSEKFTVRTRSIFIQNTGKTAASKIEIAHKRRPQHFKLYPSLNYSEITTPDGVHVVVIDSLAAKEVVTYECLSVNSIPELYYVRTAASGCKQISFTYQQIFPKWINLLIWFLVLVGAAAIISVAVMVILSSLGVIRFN